MPPSPPRRRPVVAALAALTIALGLLSRRIPALPAWLAKDAGDALYATMMFWLVGLVAPALSTARAAVVATLICFAVEFSQRVHTDWLDAVRDTRLGGLVLGHGFHTRDLACYVAGALLGAAVERLILRRASA